MTRPTLDELRRLSTTTQTYERLKSGVEYVAADRVTGITDGSVALDVFIGNDAGSERDLLVSVEFATGGASTLDVTNQATVDVAGTALPTEPKGVEVGTQAATLERDGTYSAAGETLKVKLPGSTVAGGPATATGGDGIPRARLLEPGDAIRNVVTNVSGGQANFGVTVDVIEIDPEDYIQ